MTVSTTYNCRS